MKAPWGNGFQKGSGMGFFSALFGGGNRISAQEVKDEMESGLNVILLDVREPSEFQQGHIQGARNAPLQSLQSYCEKKLPNKDTRIIVYCQSGGRSSSAAKLLKQLEYTNVANLGSIKNWPYGIWG